VLPAQVAPIYWCCNVRSTNILVLLVLAAPIGEDTQAFYNLKCLQRQYIGANWFAAPLYIGAVQGEQNCLQHHAYSVKQCLFNKLE
jgi:hypothetical protein